MSHYEINKFGRNPDVDAAAIETVWSAGGLYQWLTVDEPLTIASDSADDNANGVGLRTIELQGLDINWNEIEETVTLDGLTPVTTTSHFFRLYRAKGIDVGTNGTNVGAIVVSAPSNGATMCTVAAGEGQSQLGIYSVPLGRVLAMESVVATAFKQTAAAYEVQMFLRTALKAWRLVDSLGGHSQASPSIRRYQIPRKIPACSDIEFRVDVSTNNTGISVDFDGRLF